MAGEDRAALSVGEKPRALPGLRFGATRRLVHSRVAGHRRGRRHHRANPRRNRRSGPKWGAIPSPPGRTGIIAEDGQMGASRPVSRVLYGAKGKALRTRRPFLWDDRCRPPRAINPGDSPETGWTPRRHCRCGPRRPYSILLPVGLAMPSTLPPPRCALTAPFHPDPDVGSLPCRAVCFLWRYPWGRPRRTLSGTVFPWSPDFPPRSRATAVRPAGRICVEEADPKGKAADEVSRACRIGSVRPRPAARPARRCRRPADIARPRRDAPTLSRDCRTVSRPVVRRHR